MASEADFLLQGFNEQGTRMLHIIRLCYEWDVVLFLRSCTCCRDLCQHSTLQCRPK